MSKQTNKDMKNNISNLGKGILDVIKVNENIKSDDGKSTTTQEVNIKSEESSEDKKEKKKKRSFMFTDNTIQKLSLLDLCIEDKDLGEIVTAAVDIYFEQHKEEIKKALKTYSSIE